MPGNFWLVPTDRVFLVWEIGHVLRWIPDSPLFECVRIRNIALMRKNFLEVWLLPEWQKRRREEAEVKIHSKKQTTESWPQAKNGNK